MKENTEIYTVGIDIGNSKVCAVAGKKSADGKITILGFAEAKYDQDYESMNKGLVKNNQNLHQTAGKVLQELSQKANLDIVVASGNYSNEYIQTKSHKTELTNDGKKFVVSEIELEELVRKTKDSFKKNDQLQFLHALPTDFYMDEMKINKFPDGSTGNKLSAQFNVLLTPKTTFESYNESLDNMKYKFLESGKKDPNHEVIIDQLIYSGVADALACLSVEDKQNGVLLVNLGAQLTEITIYKEFGLRYTYVLGLGTQTILQDLCQAFNINDEQAEELFLLCSDKPSKGIEINEVIEIEGSAGLPKRQFIQKSVTMVIESRLKELAGLIASNVIESGYARVLGNGIILTGGSARLGIVKLIFEKTFHPLSVRIGNPLRNIHINNKLELNHPKYATAIGTMLSTLLPLDPRIPMNKLQREKRKFTLGFLKNIPIANKIIEFLEEPELRRGY